MPQKAIRIVEPREFEIAEVPVPEPAEDEVLIKVEACATCTNWELQTWSGTDIFDRPGYPIYPQDPGSPGHEAAGVVVEVGAEVADIERGDHVAVYGNSRGPENDAHAQYITRAAEEVAVVAPGIDLAEAAPLEMAQCAVRSVDIAGDVEGKSVGVVGLGPAGILHLQVAARRGADVLVGFDMVEMRLSAGRQFADRVIDARDQEAVEEAVGDGVQIAFDCSGNPDGMYTGLRMAREKFVVFSVPAGTIEWGKQFWMHGVPLIPYHWRGDTQVNCLRRAAGMLADGELDMESIVTHIMPYSRYAEAMELLESREAIKIVFRGWE